MVITIPPEGFEQPTLFETAISVLQNPETWFLALGFVVVSSATVAGFYRFRLIESRMLVVAIATIAPLLFLQLALIFFGAGEVPESIITLGSSDLWLAMELGIGLVIGFIASNWVLRFLHARGHDFSAENRK